MALCLECSTVIPCHCHLAPPTQVRAGIYPDTSRGRMPDAFETGGQQFDAGDRVRFRRAGIRENRQRIYTITDAGPDHIRVHADGCDYTLSRDDVENLGITHADDK